MLGAGCQDLTAFQTNSLERHQCSDLTAFSPPILPLSRTRLTSWGPGWRVGDSAVGGIRSDRLERVPGLSFESVHCPQLHAPHQHFAPEALVLDPHFFQCFLHWGDCFCHPHGVVLWEILPPGHFYPLGLADLPLCLPCSYTSCTHARKCHRTVDLLHFLRQRPGLYLQSVTVYIPWQ